MALSSGCLSSRCRCFSIVVLSFRSAGPVCDSDGDDQRLKLHLAAVLCNNFVNHLYALTERYCKMEGLDFQLLLPLIKETAARWSFSL